MSAFFEYNAFGKMIIGKIGRLPKDVQFGDFFEADSGGITVPLRLNQKTGGR